MRAAASHLPWSAILMAAMGCQAPAPNAGSGRSATDGYAFRTHYPTADGAAHARDDADHARAVVAYRFWYPTVSTEAILRGNRAAGIEDNKALPILSAQPRHVGFTLNSDTPYSGGALDLSAGPMVVELPPGPYMGMVNDHHQRWVMDLGLPGPDAGKGGKHLILPPGWTGKVPAGYHVGRAQSFKVLLGLRSLPVGGDVPKAMDALRAVKVHALAPVPGAAASQFVDMNDQDMFTAPLKEEANIEFWKMLHDVIEAEPVVDEFRPMYGLLTSLGIGKGQPFAPDARMLAILERAARDGRDQMLVSAFASARADRMAWPDRKWEWASLVSDDANFETPAGLDIEARDRWFGQAIVASPAMFRRTPGAGSLYWLGVRDKDGNYLDGARTYRLAIPLPVPGNLFWSVTVYDAETRSQVQTEQQKAALRSLFELKDLPADPSVDLFFGPSAPAGREARWIRTVPGRGWFAYIRIYGPDGPAFDGSWKPGDFELVP